MRLAALQMQSIPADTAANLGRIAEAARGAASRGAQLMVTPELGLTGYGAGHDLVRLAEPADGPLFAALSGVARASGIAIVAGWPEAAEGAVYNSVMMVDGTGPAVVYRKSHLYGTYEKRLFRPAAPSTCLFRLGGITFGLLICYDVEFPENVRRLARAGAEAVLVPTALPAGASGRFIAGQMLPVRAFENQVFVAYVDHCGRDEHFTFAGLSRIVAPDGGVLAEAPAEGDLLMTADLDPAAYAASRAENTYLADLERLSSLTGPSGRQEIAPESYT